MARIKRRNYSIKPFLPYKNKYIYLDKITYKLNKLIKKFGGKTTTSIKKADYVYINSDNSKLEKCCIKNNIFYYSIDELEYRLYHFDKIYEDKNIIANIPYKYLIYNNEAYKIRFQNISSYLNVNTYHLCNYYLGENIKLEDLEIYANYDISLIIKKEKCKGQINQDIYTRFQILKSKDMYYFYSFKTLFENLIYNFEEYNVDLMEGNNEIIKELFNNSYKKITGKDWLENDENIDNNIAFLRTHYYID